MQHIWSHLSPSATVWAEGSWVEGRTTGQRDKLVLWPLPMIPQSADPSCHPSIQIPLISATCTLPLGGRRRPELALSLRCTRIPTEEAPTGTLIAKAKGHPSSQAQWGH
ncbi:hypothetical protein PBY51_014421 [Eleginops maclovinus]|uniref:Uncharacterized protein n=1 Tax=Eleginops maclovinus TaxID=56733 RepID=A0AAN7WWU3_ELEMC|nr:hypothetical protein PBY51_014421 [Eleginops maclovinus]